MKYFANIWQSRAMWSVALVSTLVWSCNNGGDSKSEDEGAASGAGVQSGEQAQSQQAGGTGGSGQRSNSILDDLDINSTVTGGRQFKGYFHLANIDFPAAFGVGDPFF